MRSRYYLFTLLAVTAFGIAACAPAAAPQSIAAPSQPPAPTTAATAANGSTTGGLIPLRFSSIVNASQSYIPVLMMEKGIGKKYGFDVTLVPLTTTGEQWTSMRSGDADISSGSFLDLLRQRQAGLKATAIRGFSTFGNAILTLPSKPYSKLSDLKGVRVGTPSTVLLDWMILRAAGKKAEGFDIGTEAVVSQSSPPLLNQLMLKNQLDAALQFAPDFALAPVTQGTLKEVTTVPKVMAEAGFDPTVVLYLTFNLSDSWRAAHPNDVPKLVAAMDEAVNLLETDDTVWPDLAKRSGVTDSALLPKFMAAERASFKTTFGPQALAPTQSLIDAIGAIVGTETLGVTKVDPAAFDFDSATAAKKLEKGP
jgi:NitT/TauT family transport system substrate-binding protein